MDCLKSKQEAKKYLILKIRLDYMKKKPDLLIILAFVFGFGVLVSSYTMGQPDPQRVAAEILKHQ